MIARPDVGSYVEVIVIDPFASRMIPPQSDTRRYQGRVVKSDRWLTDQEFAMTGDHAYPIRVINLRHVRDIVYETGQGTNIDDTGRIWEITGSRGDRYLVTRDARGYSCDCKGFQFRKSCRHITEVHGS